VKHGITRIEASTWIETGTSAGSDQTAVAASEAEG
jgi:hypothetical protein